MILSPYNSTACRGYDLSKVIQGVMIERIDGKVIQEYMPVELLGPSSPEPPIFTQPLTALEFGDRKDRPEIIVDARSLIRMSRNDERTFTVMNHNEMELALVRSRLQVLWQTPDFPKQDMLRAGDLPAQVFINWLSKTLVNKLGLDPAHQMVISAITGYYYACLFYEAAMVDSDAKAKMAQQISRWTRIGVADVLEIIDELPYLNDVNDYIAVIKSSSDSSRMTPLNLGLLFVLLRATWFGANSQETVTVALEHPPTFLALVYCSLQLRGYRNATMAKIVNMAVRNGNDKDLVKNLAFLLKPVGGSY